MYRRFSTLVKTAPGSSSSPSTYRVEEKQVVDDARSQTSTASTVVREVEGSVTVPSLKIKRVDYYYSPWSRPWKYRVPIFFFLSVSHSPSYQNTSKVTVESLPIIHSTSNDAWKDCSFV